MKHQLLYLTLLIIVLCVPGAIELKAQNTPATQTQKEVAITIDDLPLNGPQFDAKRLQVMTDKILAAIKENQVPAVGFVNESLLYRAGEVDTRIAILKSWIEAGVELGNHTFSHLGFRNASLADYEDDFIRGDALTRMLMKEKGQKPRYFRHPYLQMARTQEIEKAFQNFIAERGYTAAPVTVDSLDWMILAAYNKARSQNDAEMLKSVSSEYIKYVERRFEFSEQSANDLFGRPIKHILLLHANELNGDSLDGLFKMLKNRGYRFVTLDEALKDPVYQFPDKYLQTSDWLGHWAFSKGKKLNAPALPDTLQKLLPENQR
ncbi:MAG TPA: polysaccharide deacetylase family protein [Blastocatellia bacterium]|nr:polysaccharide deacetylase family protein [Blastocatellia bacterium]